MVTQSGVNVSPYPATRRVWAPLSRIADRVKHPGFFASNSNFGPMLGERRPRKIRFVSLLADGARFSDAVRQHWSVENGLHWIAGCALSCGTRTGFAKTKGRRRSPSSRQDGSVARQFLDAPQRQRTYTAWRMSSSHHDHATTPAPHDRL